MKLRYLIKNTLKNKKHLFPLLLFVALLFFSTFYFLPSSKKNQISISKKPIPSLSPTSSPSLVISISPTPFIGPSFTKDFINYYVDPLGNDQNNGLTEITPFKTIQKAIDIAKEGSVINLKEGEYLQDFVTKRSGTKDAPIIITGPPKAVLKGGGSNRVIEINHSNISLNGFTVDGHFNSNDSVSSYRDKLIYIIGKQPKEGLNSLKITNMSIKNAGGECIRMRYFSQNNEIANNYIQNCGVHDFKFKAGGKNGEGIYIGTAPEQLGDGKNPTKDSDGSNRNWIHHNVIDTQGNECVDIKEGASLNLVENNSCTGQKDPNSGGMDSRGNENTFRFNEIFDSVGAGIRLGGDKEEDGIKNNIYRNTIKNNKGGGIKFQREPQGIICGNIMNENGTDSAGSFAKNFDLTLPCPN